MFNISMRNISSFTNCTPIREDRGRSSQFLFSNFKKKMYVKFWNTIYVKIYVKIIYVIKYIHVIYTLKHLHLLGIKKKYIILKYIIVQMSYFILNKTVKMWQLTPYSELIVKRSKVGTCSFRNY